MCMTSLSSKISMLKARCYKIILSQYCSDQSSLDVRHDLSVTQSRVYIGL